MNYKEKAKELVERFLKTLNYNEFVDSVSYVNRAKQCALLCVEEIIESNPTREGNDRGGNFMAVDDTWSWEQIKKEIERL